MIYYYLDKIVTRLKMSHFSQQTPIKRCFMPFILSLEEKKNRNFSRTLRISWATLSPPIIRPYAHTCRIV